MTHVVASFWIHRPKDFPKHHRYIDMLHILDASCRRAGFRHIVLTDDVSAPHVYSAGLLPFASELPRSLMQSTTEIQARWLESPHSDGIDTIFVGADCIVRRDFRADLPVCDFAVAYMLGHKKWRLNNGFMFVPSASREKVAPIFRLIADDTSVRMCDDMLAIERALVPMPTDFGIYPRRDLSVGFMPLPIWNYCPKVADDPAASANLMHFMGGWPDKPLMFEWAKRHGFAVPPCP